MDYTWEEIGINYEKYKVLTKCKLSSSWFGKYFDFSVAQLEENLFDVHHDYSYGHAGKHEFSLLQNVIKEQDLWVGQVVVTHYYYTACNQSSLNFTKCVVNYSLCYL